MERDKISWNNTHKTANIQNMLTTEHTHSCIKCSASLLDTELLSHKLTKPINIGQYPSVSLQALTWLQGPDYCPLIRHNPGLFLVFLQDITP
jgi:hypothetical protein